jgi:hypothetical protein
MKEVQQRFRWMVLHNLNIQGSSGSDQDGDGDNDVNMLEEVQDKDDLDVLRSLGIGPNDVLQRRSQKGRPGDGPSIAYPLGTMPTWTELVKAIQEKPLEIIKSWIYNPSWTMSTKAEKIVCAIFAATVDQSQSHLDRQHSEDITYYTATSNGVLDS